MIADFDKAAPEYDKDFTNSAIGTLQRQRVWRLLDQALVKSKELKILELNCGTGEDAIRFTKEGHTVVATDISEEMLNVAESKNDSKSVKFMKLDLNDFDQTRIDSDFDLVFSNFGGLNCIDEESMIKLGNSLSNVLKPQGQFIAVIMPKVCLWESLYLLLKSQFSEIFRRSKEYAEVNVSGKTVKTWYYNPKGFSYLIGRNFKAQKSRPIGLFIPPSYMEGFFVRNPRLLRFLNFLESIFANFSWQSRFSDHYYIQYKLR